MTAAQEHTIVLADRLAAATDGSVLLIAEKVAEILSVGRSTVFELIATGELRSVKIGRARRITVSAVREYVARLEAEAD